MFFANFSGNFSGEHGGKSKIKFGDNNLMFIFAVESCLINYHSHHSKIKIRRTDIG